MSTRDLFNHNLFPIGNILGRPSLIFFQFSNDSFLFYTLNQLILNPAKTHMTINTIYINTLHFIHYNIGIVNITYHLHL